MHVEGVPFLWESWDLNALHTQPAWEGSFWGTGEPGGSPLGRAAFTGEPVSCCPGTETVWFDYRVRVSVYPSAVTLGFGLKPLAVSFTSSYLQPHIRLIKKQLPVGS